MAPRSRDPLPFAYRAVVAILRPLLMVLTRRDWHGAENLPREGGFVATPNHLSYTDPLVFAHFMLDNGRPAFFLGKEGVFRVPVVGAILRAAQQIPVYRNTGYGTEAVKAVLTLGFEKFKFHRIFARTAGKNEASARLLKDLGMRLEAHYREHALFQGEWDEELHFAILDREWQRGSKVREITRHKVA